MFTSSGSTGGGRGYGGGDAETIISPNTSFGDIININEKLIVADDRTQPTEMF